MLSQKIASSIAFFEKYIPDIVKPTSIDAIVTLYVTDTEIDEKTLKLLKIFVMSHCNMNKDVTVYIFTNHETLINKFINSQRLKVVFIPYANMGYDVLKNGMIYNILQKFNKYKRVFIFDIDLLPVNKYSNLKMFHKGYDIGFTYNNEWKIQNRFPFNGGFFIINFENKSNIKKFIDLFINIWDFVYKNQNEIYEKKIINHEPENYPRRDLSDWYGDQYIMLFLLKKRIDSSIKIFADWKENEINHRVFNDSIFNFSSIELKRNETFFDINGYFKRKIFPKRFFIHLKGNVKNKFVEQIAQLLNISI
jgi:hypothetical protein